VTRRGFALVLVAFAACLGSFGLASAADAQRSGGTIHHIGYLSPGPGYPFEAFRDGLQELGYVEGRNIAIERRSAEGKPERLQDLAAELAGAGIFVCRSSQS
jgi:putative tryptophan/tyrosine transport system substrate-binding protein